ncbi:MAG: endonuclease/exonuclease/phosphatase family protein [Saprospiraceae bacterium]|nr:endonuclease/exonuclease/phosphatase family protein [Saprospiraceae bacterium]
MRSLTILFFSFTLLYHSSTARVLSVQFDSRDTVLNGRNWGEAGSYEILKGKVFFGTDPTLPQNQNICDLRLAPRDNAGLVLSSADLVVLKPTDASKSSLALVEVSNRGGKFTLSYFLDGNGHDLDPQNPLPFGDGLLLKRGVTIIWVGWQFDLPDHEQLLNFNTPTVKYPEGTPITGLVRSDWTVDEATNNLGLGHRNQIGYRAYDPASQLHKLTRRAGRDTPRIPVPRSEWNFGRWENGQVEEDLRCIYSEKGFEAGYIYELVYYAANPVVVGLGLAAIRDIISFAKYDPTCPFPVKFGIAAGVSQTGRFIRQFNYQSFNEDESGRKAYDGQIIITAGAGRGSFNHRFAQPSRDAHRYSAFLYPTDIFPFSSGWQKDPLTEDEDGILSHLDSEFIPKIFSVNTGYEYWGRSASLIHTDLTGKEDVLPESNERIFHIASGQHYVGAFPPQNQQTLYFSNPLEFRPNYRALLVCLMDWVSDGKEPPASAIPIIASGTLVSPAHLDYPRIPDFMPASKPQEPYRVDYGPEWPGGIIAYQPPYVGEAFPILVPQVDRFGNEQSGILNAEITVPLATFIPYSLRQNLAGGNGEIADFVGTFIPLPRKKNVADQRTAIEDLYVNKFDYLQQVQQHLYSLVENRFLLVEDLHRILMRSSAYWNWIMSSDSAKDHAIKIMSFNIRYDNPGDGASRWKNRIKMVTGVIDSFAPDFLGLQEALRHQCVDVARRTKNYQWFGVGREDGKVKGEFAPIFYNRKNWKLVDQNSFWLSQTPNEPSKGWDAAHERIVTYGKFRNKKSDLILYVFNTHFDHRGETARINSARLIREKLTAIAEGHPFLLTGDFNMTPQTEAYRTLIRQTTDRTVLDAKIISLNTPTGPSGTFSGFNVEDILPTNQIDYIFCSEEFSVKNFHTIVKSENDLYASDHFPVLAEMQY